MRVNFDIGPCLLRLILALLLSAPLLAADEELDEDGPIQRGHRAYVTGDYQKAASLWTPLAEQGIAQAQFYLGNLYARGEGVEADPVAALSWLTRAAQGGYAVAQFNLGNHYYQGLWVKQDYGQALEWWRKAAEQNLPRAAYNLGSLYYQGQGAEKNLEQALHWYRIAAQAGSTEAKVVLAKLEAGGEIRAQPPVPVTASTGDPKPVAKKPVKPLATASVSRAAESAPVVVGTPEESAAWIHEQAPGHYTIQLFAANSVAAIESFVQGFNALDRLAVFGFVREGKPYFAVIHGSYKTKAEADQRAAKLTGVSFWVRSFGGIRKIMVE